MVKFCLSILNEHSGLHILLWYWKVIDLWEEDLVKVQDWHNARCPSFMRENISLAAQVFPCVDQSSYL